MRLIADKEFDRKQVLESIIRHIMHRYDMLRQGMTERLRNDYHRSLYKLNEPQLFALPDGSRFVGEISGVEPQGALKIVTQQGEERKFLFKEVEFVLKN
jgi:BirA family biotin operon repressor/biotin-[acetyl-CoA-carboxylase] ligase